MEPYSDPKVGRLEGYKAILDILTPYIDSSKRYGIYATPERTIIFETTEAVSVESLTAVS